MPTKDPYLRLLNYAFWLLGRKNYSEAEILKKFKTYTAKKNLVDAEALIERVLARLHELKYIDDDRILQNYFEYKLASKPVGKYRFLNEMRRIGIPKAKAVNAWESKNIDEEALALQLLEARKRRFHGLTGQARKKKIVSLLGGRGFAPDVIWKVLDRSHSDGG